MCKGRVHSIQSLGTVDGPGVRFVVFMQGCRLRCGYCHNPDTWAEDGGTLYAPQALADTAGRYKDYFGKSGGITVSGGEPLLQADFVKELFILCHQKGIHTCLDTAGSLLNDAARELLLHTDYVLLDIKFTEDALYKQYTGCSMETPLAFLRTLDEMGIPTTVRQVIVPGLTDTPKNIKELSSLVNAYGCIKKTELLPFKKLCSFKYDAIGIPFPFAAYDTPSGDTMQRLEKLLENY